MSSPSDPFVCDSTAETLIRCADVLAFLNEPAEAPLGEAAGAGRYWILRWCEETLRREARSQEVKAPC